jgi:hypothetical protein
MLAERRCVEEVERMRHLFLQAPALLPFLMAEPDPPDKQALAVMVVDGHMDAANLLSELLKAVGITSGYVLSKSRVVSGIEQTPQVFIFGYRPTANGRL